MVFAGNSSHQYIAASETSLPLIFNDKPLALKLIIFIGITISACGAAVHSLIGASRILHMIANDEVLIRLKFLQKTYWRNEPFRSLWVSFLFGFMITMIGDIPQVSEITTILFLICFIILHFAAAIQGFLNNPSWRPSWKWYHWSISAVGAISGFVLIFWMNWIISVILMSIITVGYRYVEYKGAEKHWGNGLVGLNLQIALKNLLKLERNNEIMMSRNWRPQILLLVNIQSTESTGLISFVGKLKKGSGLLILAYVLKGSIFDESLLEEKKSVFNALHTILTNRKIDGFVEVLIANSLQEGISSSLQTSGLGLLRPNTVFIGMFAERHAKDATFALKYMNLIETILQLDQVLVISKSTNKIDGESIDVWWMMHDGGLLILLPYLLRKHKDFRKCQLRIFALAGIDVRLNDNSILMKSELETLIMEHYRIEAVIEVVELAGEYLDEKTRDTDGYIKREDKIHQYPSVFVPINVSKEFKCPRKKPIETISKN
ncbi:hypothetical protein ROZALSC1DRAFT_27715 [Rozella allomycis CSF55]|uniref:Amino acid permease/ SLC12A domain-containing protein n=1 Tax=Rozella allomycis (strain CSF55) TaxID=988480 RepID=A0A075AZ33_ROZAC|nr:hypothetical protein O9G_005067 [Rozella allomycis CSF55]RKP20836.1 hypothetical protein ROZALSC1DRAFT_27715 [Rozella allomycis CSF55]|eukprot:EPZ33972.1 hypothetical protein O9G_005067 [Rozella allomycis CSF55]